MQIETLFTIDPYLGTDQMINPALVVAGIRDTLPARVGAMSPAKARLGEYGRKMLASRYLQRVTNVTPGTVSTAGNPHVGNELFGLLDGGGQPALQRVGASGSGTIQSSSPEQPLHQKAANERFRVNKGLACRRRVGGIPNFGCEISGAPKSERFCALSLGRSNLDPPGRLLQPGARKRREE